IVLTSHLINRVDGNSRRPHVDQKLREAVTPIVLGRGRCPEQTEHIIGDMRVARPDLRALDAPTFVNFRCFGLSGEQVEARAGFANADDEAQLTAAYAR